MPSRLARIKAAQTLDELYALVPSPVDCTGECWDSCGPIGYSAEEGERMEQAGHRPPNVHEEHTQLMCTALTEDNRCSIYDARPMICRVWGVADLLPCTFEGCHTLNPLTAQESAALMMRSLQIGGEAPAMTEHYELRVNDLRELISRSRKEWNC